MGKRIVVGIVLVALLIVVLCLGIWAQAIVFAALAAVAVYEVGCALRAKNYKPFSAMAYVFAVSLALVPLLPVKQYLPFWWMLCLMIVVTERIINRKRTTPDLFAGLLPFVWPLPFFACVLVLCAVEPWNLSLSALVLAIAAPSCADIFAYFVGRLIGKHKLCPDISPKKTVEGSIGSFFGGVVGGVVTFYLQTIWGGQLTLPATLILGGVCGLIGQIGDLLASTVKRWAGIKDFGTLLPGHGGVLDRTDSILFCVPVILAYTLMAF